MTHYPSPNSSTLYNTIETVSVALLLPKSELSKSSSMSRVSEEYMDDLVYASSEQPVNHDIHFSFLITTTM